MAVAFPPPAGRVEVARCCDADRKGENDDGCINIHTTGDPGGEIRGFLAAVPEPATWAMMLIGFLGLGFAFRQSRRREAIA
jgi:PEP-CTERM motif